MVARRALGAKHWFFAGGVVAFACVLPDVSIVDSLHDDDQSNPGGASGTDSGKGGAAGSATGGKGSGNEGGEDGSGGSVGTGGTAEGGTSGSSSGKGGGSGKGGSNGTGGSNGGDAGSAGKGGSGNAGGNAGSAGGGMGNMGGSAGATNGGAGGMSGAGGTDLRPLAVEFDGLTMLAPCMADLDIRQCQPTPSGPCPMNADPILPGAYVFDRTVTMGGTPGVTYNVTLHFQGVVEGKTFQGGADSGSSGTQNPADGFFTGGSPNNTINSYGTFAIRVSSPTQNYYLNSIAMGSDTRIRHSAFRTDFTATIPVTGGSSVRFVIADTNCSMIKNCADPDVATECNPVTFTGLDSAILTDIGSQPYNGQFTGMRVVDVTTN